MTALVEFLRARLAEDEQAARNAAADHPAWTYDPERFAVYADGYTIASHRDGSPLADVDGAHIARHDPARVLAEVDAKRRIIDDYERAIRNRDAKEPQTDSYRHWSLRALALYRVLLSLAAVYADHPDSLAQWEPA